MVFDGFRDYRIIHKTITEMANVEAISVVYCEVVVMFGLLVFVVPL